MSKILNSIIIAIVFLASLVLSNTNVLAQTDDTTEITEETKPILFVLDTCPYCNALLNELEENDLTDKVEIVEVSEDPAKSTFEDVITACGVKTAVPTLLLDERCFQGQYSARDRIFAENLVPLPKDEDLPPSESATIIDDISSVDGTTEDGVVDVEEEAVANENDDGTQKSLGNKIVNFNDSGDNYSWLTFLAALLAPTVLIIISYLIIVKMKV